VLAINILGRFLMNKDNNIRYVALNTLTRVVNIDLQAVQRHRATVVECLKDHDSSIRKRALDLTYALVNKANIKVLVRELLNYLIAADIEFRGEITAQICLLTRRYAPTPKWHIDTILKVMTLAGHYVQPETVSDTIHLIQDTPDLQAYAVHKLYLAVMKDITRQALVCTAVWVIGEFGDLLLAGGKDITPDNIFEILETIIKHPASEQETKQFTLTAMLKLTDRLENPEIRERFLTLLETYRGSLTLELQQRSCEYHSILTNMPTEKVEELLDHMPAREREEMFEGVMDDSASSTPQSERRRPAEPEPEPAPQQELLSLVNDPAPQSTNDLLSGILGGGSTDSAPSAPAATSPPSSNLLDLLGGSDAPPQPTAPSSGGDGGLLDLMGSSSGPAPGIPAAYGSGHEVSMGGAGIAPTSPMGSFGSNTSMGSQGGAIPPLTAFEKGGVKIVYSFVKQPNMPNVTLVNATVTNATPVPLEQFTLQIAVPPFMKVQMGPTSGNMVPPNNSGQVVQQFKIANSMHGQQPPAVKMKLDFVVNGRAVGDMVAVYNFPQGV